MYASTANALYFHPRKNPARAIAKVCKVRDTPVGILIDTSVQTAMIAVKSAVFIIFLSCIVLSSLLKIYFFLFI